MNDDLAMWLGQQIADAEARTRTLLYWAQQTILTLQDPKLLGRYIPGWHDWPDVETMCQQRLAELAAARHILAAHEADVHRCDGGDFAVGVDCPVKRQMAAPYAGQPGCRDEWRPQ